MRATFDDDVMYSVGAKPRALIPPAELGVLRVSLVTSALPPGGPFFCPAIDGAVAAQVESVAATAIPAAVHEALGVVARRYAAQLNNLSA